VIERRGAVPEVALAALRPQTGAAAPAAGPVSAGAPARGGVEGARSAPVDGAAPRRLVFAGDEAQGAQEPVRLERGELSPWPELDETTTVEELLLLVKERLERLYRLVHGEGGGEG
jgi:hypothetical protein